MKIHIKGQGDTSMGIPDPNVVFIKKVGVA